ncbi:hypothetical protein GJ688_13865 [Heliobacillus mobilis]|uniref:Uncharacterized protein n=1 Tax=Heliobacterium mobile TaxID=28064 RepID=A0A6I3SM52_HELMO|nr:hypothetical protein [Heliobacterium mobile]MTV50058.1 hypothetical protein [Heliobacterium mobile]
MREFIREKMNCIYQDLNLELQLNGGNCCELKEVRFDGYNLPDYSLPMVQQLYLLRYFPAYLFEYYDIYKTLLNLNFINTKEINVLSIGAGCWLDYYGLHFALRDTGTRVKRLSYTPLDKIEWMYTDDLGNDCCYPEISDITNWSSLDWDRYNIIMFPKSIGEFSNETFGKLITAISNTEFCQTEICILCSYRATRVEYDVARLRAIVNTFINVHNYTSLDAVGNYYEFPDGEYYSDIHREAVYPKDIYDAVSELLCSCDTYRRNNYNSCEDDCKSLNRRPMKKTSYIKYDIIRLKWIPPIY